MHWNILLAVLLAAGADSLAADSVPYGVASRPSEIRIRGGIRGTGRMSTATARSPPWMC